MLPEIFRILKEVQNTAIPMVTPCCYHGQSPPITTNHPPITSEIYPQSPSNHLKITSTGTTNHRPVTSTEHETFSLLSLCFFLSFSLVLVQSRLFFPSLAAVLMSMLMRLGCQRELITATHYVVST